MNQWEPPPTHFTLDPGCVDVWLIDVNEARDELQSFTALLSRAEQERAARFKFDKDRRLFTVAHAALRSILASYLKIASTSLEFADGAKGKPKFAPALAGRGVEFTLSHSHQTALLGVAQGREVGVDVEYVKRDFQFADVAKRFFTPSEVDALQGLPPQLQREAFFKCWTSKEAFLKAKGTGLSGKLDEVEITLTAEQRVQITANVPGWSLIELDPGDDYEGALVVEGAPLPVRCFYWEQHRSV
jgi:4'-phosphopantetheinyl transferase